MWNSPSLREIQRCFRKARAKCRSPDPPGLRPCSFFFPCGPTLLSQSPSQARGPVLVPGPSLQSLTSVPVHLLSRTPAFLLPDVSGLPRASARECLLISHFLLPALKNLMSLSWCVGSSDPEVKIPCPVTNPRGRQSPLFTVPVKRTCCEFSLCPHTPTNEISFHMDVSPLFGGPATSQLAQKVSSALQKAPRAEGVPVICGEQTRTPVRWH